MTSVRDQDLNTANSLKDETFSMIPFPPDGIDINDIREDGGLFTNEEKIWIDKQFADGKKYEGKYSKRLAHKNNLGKELSFSVDYASDSEGKKRWLGEYEGKRGAGAFGSILYVYDDKNKEWLVKKIISEKKKKPKKKPKKPEAEPNQIKSESFSKGNAFGTIIINDVESNTNTSSSKDEDIAGEYCILKKLSLARGYFDSTSPSKKIKQQCIFMPLAPGIPLSKLEKISPEEFLDITVALLKVFRRLHEVDLILHRDIKDENIMYDRRSGKITLIDWGLAVRFTKENRGVKDVPSGTREWTAPEIREIIEIETILNMLRKFKIRLEKDALCDDTIKKINSYEISNLDQKSILELNEILSAYLDELEVIQPEYELKIEKIKNSIKDNRCKKQYKLLDDYLNELEKDKATNAIKISDVKKIKKGIKSGNKHVDRIQLKKHLNDYQTLLEKQYVCNKDIIERIKKCTDENQEAQQLEYQTLTKLYVVKLTKRKQDIRDKIEIIINSLCELNIYVPSTISEIAEALIITKTSSHTNNTDTEIKRQDVNEFLKLALNFFLDSEDTKDTVEETKNPKPTHQELKTAIDKLLKQLKAEENKCHGAWKERIPALFENLIEYSEKTDVYSIGDVILDLLKKVETKDEKKQDFIQNIVNEFFLKHDWSDPDKRPTVKDIFLYFRKLRKSNSKNHSHNKSQKSINETPSAIKVAMIDCYQLLDTKEEVSKKALRAILSSLNQSSVDEVVLVRTKKMPFRHYDTIRNAMEKKNIKVRQKILFADNQPPEKITKFISEYDNQIRQKEIQYLTNLSETLLKEQEAFDSKSKPELQKQLKEHQAQLDELKAKRVTWLKIIDEKEAKVLKLEKENDDIKIRISEITDSTDEHQPTDSKNKGKFKTNKSKSEIKNESELDLEKTNLYEIINNEKNKSNKVDQLNKLIELNNELIDRININNEIERKQVPDQRIIGAKNKINEINELFGNYTKRFTAIHSEILMMEKKIKRLKNSTVIYLADYLQVHKDDTHKKSQNKTLENKNNLLRQQQHQDAFFAQYARQRLLRNRLIAGAIILSFIFTPLSLLITAPIAWLYYRRKELVKKLKTTQAEIKKVKSRKKAWKESNLLDQKPPKTNKSFQKVLLSRSQNTRAKPEKKEFLVDTANYQRFKSFLADYKQFRLFGKHNQKYLNLRIKLEEVTKSKQKSANIISKLYSLKR